MKLFTYNDGGRKTAGYTGKTNDCVVRAIAIATEKPYKEVYEEINKLAKDERITKRLRTHSNSRTGVHKKTYERYLKDLGWEWIPTMKIGSGCKFHLVPWELPEGRLICRLSKHLTTM